MTEILKSNQYEQVFNVLHMFCGSGGAALGMQNSKHEYKGVKGKFKTIVGIDNDPYCCIDFKRLTKADAVCMDLFSRSQYENFNQKKPPEGWKEVVPEDIKIACKGVYPDVVFLSPPCKGFSALLPEQTSKSQKYQALNELVTRSIWLVMEAFKDNPPSVILIENVPRIKTRGKKLLDQVKSLLKSYKYVFHEGTHECGELGGLSQIRKRYLLIGRNPKKMPSFIYEPPKQRVRTIREALEKLPLPGDVKKAGAMHKIPNLSTKTWVRLALIPAGKDWRALNNLQHKPRNGAWRIVSFDEPAPTITGSIGPGKSNGISGVADPRFKKYKVIFKEFSKLDNNINKYISVDDPGLNYDAFSHAMKVMPYDQPSQTITSAHSFTGGIVADPKGEAIDPYFNKKIHSDCYGVQEWNKPSKAILGAGDVHSAAAAVADPRISKRDGGVMIIISEDGTWHRPLTTLEMAILQGLPTHYPDGEPLTLAGKSDKRWREHIGNMVPIQTATAIGNTLLQTLMPNSKNDWHWGFSNDIIWVKENKIKIKEKKLVI